MQIKLNNLKKTYSGPNGKIAAVNGISLDIPENTIFGIIGKSGAGKSSLVRLISLLEKPDEGEIFYDNDRVDNLGKRELILRRRKIGMIFQNFNLFSSRTAEKNIAYPLEICGTPKEVIKPRVQEMLKLVGLEDRAASPISTLSGGQKQRIAIARALATQPDILFCDEATSALDPQTTTSILNLIRDIQKKMNLTVVMITHQMEVVRDACSKVAVISDGKVVEQGSVSDIFINPKNEVTRDFISHIASVSQNQISKKDVANVSFTLTSEKDPEMIRWSQEGGEYELSFPSNQQGEPVLSTIAKKFDVEFNIRAAGVQKLTDTTVGKMIVDFGGSQIKEALDYLKEKQIIVKKAGE